jgi:Reverse transcriptase (RNA-dependent DNA polymerase)
MLLKLSSEPWTCCSLRFWKTAIFYLDDIIIFSQSVDAHLGDVYEVLSMIKAAGLSMNLRKSELFRSRMDYLGHVVRPGKLALAAKKTNAVAEWAMPRTKTEVQRFVAFCSVFRRFIPRFARIAGLLNKVLKRTPLTLLK